MLEVWKGLYNHSKGKHEKAMSYYKKAIEQDTSDIRAYSGCSILLLRDGRYEQARDILQKGLRKLSPKGKKKEIPLTDWAQLHSNLALTYWKLGDLDTAVDEYMAVYKKYKNTTLYGSLGFLLIAQGDATGDYSRALSFNQEAYEYASDDHVILDNLGQLYFRTGDMVRAEEMLRAALKTHPLQVDSLYYLASILKQQGKSDEALSVISKALQEGSFGALNTVSKEQAMRLRDELASV